MALEEIEPFSLIFIRNFFCRDFRNDGGEEGSGREERTSGEPDGELAVLDSQRSAQQAQPPLLQSEIELHQSLCRSDVHYCEHSEDD